MTIEFRSDGTTDSLTHLLAPSCFLDNLQAAYSQACRKGDALTIISLRINLHGYTSVPIHSAIMVAMAREVKSKLRAIDFAGRISETGFWICVHGDLPDAQAVAERIVGITPRVWTVQFIRLGGEDGIVEPFEDWIGRVDQVHYD